MNITSETPPPPAKIVRIELTNDESQTIKAWMQNMGEDERHLRENGDPRADIIATFRRYLFDAL